MVGGRYELLEQIGGSSWRAADTELEREVLVRMPAAGVGAARLSHPSIVQVFDQGEHEGESYAVLEYAGGGTLAQRLESGGIDAATGRRVAADVTAALAYAHAQGVTHGSLGPEQVLFDAEGNPKVAGFGGPPEGADDDRAALAAMVALLDVEKTVPPTEAADVTAVLEPLPAAPRRKPVALIAVAAAALVLVGVAAAFLAGGNDGSGSGTTGAPGTSSTESTQQDTDAPVVPPPATTAEGSTATTAQTTTAPETTAPETTAPATTAPPPTTAPTTEQPPTTEPPATTEPPPTTEPLPPVTTPVGTIG